MLPYVQQLVRHGCPDSIDNVVPAMENLQDIVADWKANGEFGDAATITCSWFGPKVRCTAAASATVQQCAQHHLSCLPGFGLFA